MIQVMVIQERGWNLSELDAFQRDGVQNLHGHLPEIDDLLTSHWEYKAVFDVWDLVVTNKLLKCQLVKILLCDVAYSGLSPQRLVRSDLRAVVFGIQ